VRGGVVATRFDTATALRYYAHPSSFTAVKNFVSSSWEANFLMQNPSAHQRSALQIGTLALILVAGLLLALTAPRIGLGAPSARPGAEGVAITPVISYQGRLLNPTTGAPLNGSHTFVFRLYNVASGGVALWTETKDLAVANGVFSTMLGDATALPPAIFDGQDLWLGIKVGADAEATPRQRIGAAPYALFSHNADNLDGQDSAFFRNAANINAGTLADARIPAAVARDGEVLGLVLAGDGAGSGLDADLLDGQESAAFAAAGHDHDAAYVNATGPDSMAGNSSAAAVLSVTQAGAQNGVFATTASTDAGEAALYGRAGASAGPSINSVAGVFGTSSAARGVVGSSNSSDGVLGFSVSSTGVNGQSQNSNGVEGLAAAATGTVYGVRGVSNSANGGAGVRGQSPYLGVHGVANATSGLNYGVRGSTLSPGGYAGYFDAPSGGAAGRFIGNVSIVGSLSKSSGSFQIDHPLDPENKYLYHSFVESPDMMNVYNGNVNLDGNGEAWVELPAYFEALNRDFRYQLTALGGPGPNLYVAQEVQGNHFRIAGGAPGLRVSWQVTGIRQDAFARANPIVVEVEKQGEERGRFLHPEAFGLDRASSVGALHTPPAASAEAQTSASQTAATSVLQEAGP
jgi:hypothetical protein